ncbi:type II secretion system protein [Enterovibrio qingdaonensis]|uniref:type II secretion system protein n=1 Tax=Enterovibrio qingdaonensis TaxID=2899818 RepID=UPI0023639580|nr:type II secretion system protein [Enterovibrio sp. ZSDZ35]
MRQKGFTLLELIVVIVILGILAVVASPKFLNFRDDADEAVMLSMKGAIASADKLVSMKIKMNPDGLSANKSRFTLDSGETIRVRGNLPDGRWKNTFMHLVDFSDIAQVSSNNCKNGALKWCVRQRNANWFSSRGYTALGTGRGFVIFPNGRNLNRDRCYIYFLNQNSGGNSTSVHPSLIGHDFSQCS